MVLPAFPKLELKSPALKLPELELHTGIVHANVFEPGLESTCDGSLKFEKPELCPRVRNRHKAARMRVPVFE